MEGYGKIVSRRIKLYFVAENDLFQCCHRAFPWDIQLSRQYAVSDNGQGLMGMSAYSAASNGIIAFTKSIAQDLASYGITANVFSPLAKARSFINTLATFREQGVPAELIEEGAPASMKRLATVFAPFITYLASPEAANITGQHFELQADGLIGLWSDPQLVSSIMKEDGDWTIDEIRAQIDDLLKGATKAHSPIPLK